MNRPRAKTKEEAREEIIAHIRGIIRYIICFYKIKQLTKRKEKQT